MANRTSRLWIAVLLTVTDLMVFRHFAIIIWLAWAGIAWVKWTLILLLAVWTGSAAFIWLQVFYDFRSFMSESRLPVAQHRLGPLLLRRSGDV